MIPLIAAYNSGVSESYITYFGTFVGPTNIGLGGVSGASSTSGDLMNFAPYLDDFFRLSGSYLSGTPLSETSSYLGQSFASLGLTPGDYVWTWGSGDHADTFTIDVIASPPTGVPEPATWAMMLVGFAGLGYAGYRKAKSGRRARSVV
jgi:hypothetical protein